MPSAKTPPPDPSEVRLLREAIANPFVRAEEVRSAHEAGRSFAIEDWYRLAMEKAPLWCFNAWVFKALRTDGLYSSYPLSRIVSRIAKDERVDLRRMQRDVRRPYVPISDLERHLYARRISIAAGGDGSTWMERRSDDVLWVEKNAYGFQGVSEVESDYLGIGVELMHRLEALEGARTRPERDAARRELNAFVDDLGGKLAWGRPTKGPPSSVLEPLFEQGKWFFDVCWEAFPGEPSEETRAILEELHSPSDQRKRWAHRLALPMLSVCEIRSLRREARKPRGRYAHVAPRRFTVFALAHRLGEAPETLARKLPPKSDAREFFATNVSPIRG